MHRQKVLIISLSKPIIKNCRSTLLVKIKYIMNRQKINTEYTDNY